MNRFTALLPLALLAGCMVPAPYIEPAMVRIQAPFDADEAARLLRPGTGGIRGSALLRQQGGAVVTCAGFDVLLTPVTPYATERLKTLYGNADRGFLSVRARRTFFMPNPPEYEVQTRQTKCDAQGSFAFDKLSAGDYYVTTYVIWRGYNNDQGGALLQRFTVRPDEITSLVMSP